MQLICNLESCGLAIKLRSLDEESSFGVRGCDHHSRQRDVSRSKNVDNFNDIVFQPK